MKLSATLLAAALLFASPSLFAATEPPSGAAEPAPESPAPRIAPLPIEAALDLARQHLASRPAESKREIVGVQFVPPHGRAGAGFWLVDLSPYPSDRPAPADAFTSLLITMEGAIEQRGGRRPLNPAEQKARDEKAASLRRLAEAAARERGP
jgi:hypothetical protein